MIILHSTTVMRGRAAARPSCVYIVGVDVGIVDNDGVVDDNGEFVNFHFFFLNFLLKISFSLSILTMMAAK